jgi:hypothetical protein
MRSWSVLLNDASVFMPVPSALEERPAAPFLGRAAQSRGVLLTWQALSVQYDTGGDNHTVYVADVHAAALALREPAWGVRDVRVLHPTAATLRVTQRAPLRDAAAPATLDTELRINGGLLARTGFSQVDMLLDIAALVSGGSNGDAASPVDAPPPQSAAQPPSRPRTWVWRLLAPRVQALLADDRYVIENCPDVAAAALHNVAVTLAQQRLDASRLRSSFSGKLEVELSVFISSLEIMLPALERWEISTEAEDEHHTCVCFSLCLLPRQAYRASSCAELTPLLMCRPAAAWMACTSASWRCGPAAASAAAWLSALTRCSRWAMPSPSSPRCRRRVACRRSRCQRAVLAKRRSAPLKSSLLPQLMPPRRMRRKRRGARRSAPVRRYTACTTSRACACGTGSRVATALRPLLLHQRMRRLRLSRLRWSRARWRRWSCPRTSRAPTPPLLMTMVAATATRRCTGGRAGARACRCS